MALPWLGRAWQIAWAFAAAASSSTARADDSQQASERELQIDAEDLVKGGMLLADDYMHVQYSFTLDRQDMHRKGLGELWLSFHDGIPRMRLKGAARSPRFGDGEITIVVDSGTKTMHVLFKLGELHEAQCIQYPFPRIEDNLERMKRLRWRMKQVVDWQKLEAQRASPFKKTLQVNWTKSITLQFLIGDDMQVSGVDLWKGSKVIKTIRIQGLPEQDTDIPQGPEGVFSPPSVHCSPARDVVNPPARVELTPPHRKSSALNDLLLVLGGRAASGREGDWPQLFIMLSAITVPGDVAVMIEDPDPPHPELLGGVAFDYTAEVMSRGVRHNSGGSIWLNLAERSFRLRGEAKETKVGPLYMDLIARGDATEKVYANVNLTVQQEHQCVTYDYPKMSGNASRELKDISTQGLSFFAIAELNEEDCGIFVAPLARDRWIHVWVDMEGDMPNAILRSEIHKSGQVLRSTDVTRWHLSENVNISVRPPPEWGCTEETPVTGQLAHLGLQKVHKRSIELQDALYALHELGADFAVLEILGLTGDVAIMVQEPELPELWRLPSVSFSYSLYLGPANGAKTGGYTAGSFAADLENGRVRMTAGAMTANATNISVALNPGSLAVQVEEAGLDSPQCLILPLESHDITPEKDERFSAAGIFDGVEVIGQAECNRFTFLGTGAHAESVEFWFSKEENTVCGIEVLPPAGDDGSGLGALINVPAWEPYYVPGARDGDPYGTGLAAAPGGWDCRTVSEQEQQGGGLWLSLASEAPPSTLPAAVALAKLAEASGVVGLLPPRASATLSRLVITSPSSLAGALSGPREPLAKPVSIFSEDLQTFAFSFTSTFPSEGRPGPLVASRSPVGVRNHGSGEMRVDLAQRRLYLRSEAANVSAGIPRVESHVIFRGDRGRLYARTRIDDFDYETCWSVGTVEAIPVPRGGMQPNPFRRAKLWGKGFHVLQDSMTRLTDKYVFYLNQRKRAELFVESGHSLAGMALLDLNGDVSAGVQVHDWTTDPIDDGWFEPSNDWKCEDLQFLEYGEYIAEWDIVRVFFPVEVMDSPSEQPASIPTS